MGTQVSDAYSMHRSYRLEELKFLFYTPVSTQAMNMFKII